MPGGFGGFDFGGGGGGARTFHFTTSGGGPGGGAGGFSFTNPEDIFAEFMRQGGGGGMRGGSGADEEMPDIFSSFAGAGPRSSRPKMRTAGFGDSPKRDYAPEVSTVERPLPLTLEELFKGTTKKMKIKRKTFDDAGKRVLSDQILEVPIKPGLKKGSKIKFNGVGDQQAEGGRQDLHFIVEEVRVDFFFTFPFPPPCMVRRLAAERGWPGEGARRGWPERIDRQFCSPETTPLHRKSIPTSSARTTTLSAPSSSTLRRP